MVDQVEGHSLRQGRDEQEPLQWDFLEASRLQERLVLVRFELSRQVEGCFQSAESLAAVCHLSAVLLVRLRVTLAVRFVP